jgi:hypothetical protein
MLRRVSLFINDLDFTKLTRLADQEHRPVRNQAEHLLAQAIRRRSADKSESRQVAGVLTHRSHLGPAAVADDPDA